MNRGRWKDTLRFLLRQRLKGYDTPLAPELEPEVIDLLSTEIAGARLYLEYGAGGSTLLADRIGTRTISVESDRWFAAAVRRGFTGSNVTILTPNIGFTKKWGYPVFQRRTWWRLRKWHRYVSAPFNGGGEMPDLIFVDGRFRVACALEAARHVRGVGTQATLIIDDYRDRQAYHAVERYLGPAKMIGRAAVFRIVDQEIPAIEIEDMS